MSTVATYLRRHGVDFETIPHVRASTTAAEARALGLPAHDVAKTVVIKTATGMAVAALPASDRLDLHRIRSMLADDTARLATEAEIGDAFPGFELGAIPPLGSVLGVPVVLDQNLATHAEIVFADGFQTESIKMRTADLLSLEHVRVGPLATASGSD